MAGAAEKNVLAGTFKHDGRQAQPGDFQLGDRTAIRGFNAYALRRRRYL
jgi:hypothetical protein